MEIGAFFILVILVIVLAVLGGGVYGIAMWLRHRQLDPEEDKVEGPEEPERQARPEHVRHGKAQRARFVGR
jgi:flagellar basal body-associated protein FliL